jgi:hypothetical protein
MDINIWIIKMGYILLRMKKERIKNKKKITKIKKYSNKKMTCITII